MELVWHAGDLPQQKQQVSGREPAANAIASARAGPEACRTKVMVQHDKAVMRPKGADFYVDRQIHEFESPCRSIALIIFSSFTVNFVENV